VLGVEASLPREHLERGAGQHDGPLVHREARVRGVEVEMDGRDHLRLESREPLHRLLARQRRIGREVRPEREDRLVVRLRRVELPRGDVRAGPQRQSVRALAVGETRPLEEARHRGDRRLEVERGDPLADGGELLLRSGVLCSGAERSENDERDERDRGARHGTLVTLPVSASRTRSAPSGAKAIATGRSMPIAAVDSVSRILRRRIEEGHRLLLRIEDGDLPGDVDGDGHRPPEHDAADRRLGGPRRQGDESRGPLVQDDRAPDVTRQRGHATSLHLPQERPRGATRCQARHPLPLAVHDEHRPGGVDGERGRRRHRSELRDHDGPRGIEPHDLLARGRVHAPPRIDGERGHVGDRGGSRAAPLRVEGVHRSRLAIVDDEASVGERGEQRRVSRSGHRGERRDPRGPPPLRRSRALHTRNRDRAERGQRRVPASRAIDRTLHDPRRLAEPSAAEQRAREARGGRGVRVVRPLLDEHARVRSRGPVEAPRLLVEDAQGRAGAGRERSIGKAGRLDEVLAGGRGVAAGNGRQSDHRPQIVRLGGALAAGVRLQQARQRRGRRIRLRGLPVVARELQERVVGERPRGIERHRALVRRGGGGGALGGETARDA
jgi:hypothetical protein